MTAYDFTLELTGVPELTEEFMDSVFDAGCDDCTISMRGAIVSLAFSRLAESEEQAVLSAVYALAKHVDFDAIGLAPHHRKAIKITEKEEK